MWLSYTELRATAVEQTISNQLCVWPLSTG